MSDLIQNVTNGILENTSRPVQAESSGNELGKDAFLKLLCTQLQYQDPLEPSTDTQFVTQLAQYSQLEELQNLSSTSQNQQALSLVGKTVIIQTKNSSGNVTNINGTVDYVTYSNGKAKLSINGTLYSMDDLYTVIDDAYIIQQGLPGIENEVKVSFDKDNPEDITFEVNMGSGETVATQILVMLNGEVIDSKYVSLNGNKITISKDALSKLENGTYSPAVVFNDYYYTTVTGKIHISVSGTGSESADTSESAGDVTEGTGDNTENNEEAAQKLVSDQ